jgi:hypothetical protein
MSNSPIYGTTLSIPGEYQLLMRKTQLCVCQEKRERRKSKERKDHSDLSDEHKEILDVASFASMMTWLW